MEEPATPDFPRIRGPAAAASPLRVLSTERHCVRLREIRPKGVLARPGTPRDPKSHMFATKWVAIKDLDAAQTRNLTRISVQIFLEGSRGSYLNFCSLFLDLGIWKMSIFDTEKLPEAAHLSPTERGRFRK